MHKHPCVEPHYDAGERGLNKALLPMLFAYVNAAPNLDGSHTLATFGELALIACTYHVPCCGYTKPSLQYRSEPGDGKRGMPDSERIGYPTQFVHFR